MPAPRRRLAPGEPVPPLYRKVTPYQRWKRSHPGETITYFGWLEIQVARAEALVDRLQKELTDERVRRLAEEDARKREAPG